jgi:Carboxypeptidase regulatory-like domain/TonB-dependent Receptor Plug Domain
MSRYRRIAVAIALILSPALAAAELTAQRFPVPRPITPSPTSSPTRPATGPALARILGTVWDSIAMRPLGAATVRIVRADAPSIGRSATTSATGRFAFDSVPAGTWLATFLHPLLDSLRIEPGILRIDITESGEIRVPLSTPSPRAMIASTCRAPLAAEFGMIVGEIRKATDDSPITGAMVFVEWPEWVLSKGRMVTEMRRLTSRSDSSGRYALCGVPANSSLRTLAWSGADTTGAIEVPVPEAGFALQDFAIGTSERVTVQLDTTAATPAAPTGTTTADLRPTTATAAVTTARRGRAGVTGIVRTLDGRPIANAVVRILGSGSQVRSASDGSYRIADAASGTQSLEARAIGYAPTRVPVQLRDGEAVSMTLRMYVQRVQLDTVRVVAGKTIPNEVRAIERRMNTGVGTILDARTIRERSTVFVTDALRGMAGVTISKASGNGQEILMRRVGGTDGSYCPANIVLDGVRMPPSASANATLDDYVNLSDIAAIEVYPRPNLVPPEFFTQDNACGVVVVWTRRGTGGVMPQKAKPPATP